MVLATIRYIVREPSESVDGSVSLLLHQRRCGLGRVCMHQNGVLPVGSNSAFQNRVRCSIILCDDLSALGPPKNVQGITRG